MDCSFRCRKCRYKLFDPESLIDEQRLETGESPFFTQWFLKQESCPEWVEQLILKEQYTRGKLICPRCMGRVGAFDFVGKREHYQLGPVWVQKCRVDLDRRITVAPVPLRPLVSLPLCTDGVARNGPVDIDPSEFEVKMSNGGEGSAQLSNPNTHSPVKSTRTRGDVDSEGSLAMTADLQREDVESSTHSDVDPTVNRFEPLFNDTDTALENAIDQVNTEDGEEETQEDNAEEKESPSEPESAYTCPICLDVLYQAHTCRPCLHVYCAPCLRRLCGATPINTKCPLCRRVITACLPNHEMTNLVKSIFPQQYSQRKSSERKNRSRLPPLPSSNGLAFTHFHRERHRNYVLVHWAGVCFVVLLVVMAISILATTVGMLLWYLWETFMDYFIDGLVSVNGYFDYSWQLVIMILLEKSDEISPELAKMLAGSFGQLLHAVGKLFNRTLPDSAKHLIPPTTVSKRPSREEDEQTNYTFSAIQVDLANYALVVCVVTYLIYRFARYRQARQVEAAAVLR